MQKGGSVYLLSKSSNFCEEILKHLTYTKGLALIADLWEARGVLSEQNIWIQLRTNLKGCTEEWDGRRRQDAGSL